MRALTGAALLALAVYAGACLLLFIAQRSLIYFPPPRSTAADSALERLSVPGATLAVSVRRASGPRALIYLGGNAEDVATLLPELSAALPGESLHLLHYRGFGGSSGTPSEEALHADALALYDHVRTTHPQIRVVGRSLGAALAVRLARERPVSQLVLITPFDSLQRLAAAQFPLFPVRWLLRDRYDAWHDAPHVRAPTTLIVAGRDEIVPPESAQRLLAHFPAGVARQVMVEGAGHNDPALSPARLPALR